MLIGGAFALSCGGKSSPTSPTTLEVNSGNIAANGGVYAHQFMTAGTYNYHCAIHPQMQGTVTVVASGSNAGAAVGIADFAFNPSSTSINVGTTVTWTNGSTTTAHTVTSN